MLAKLPNRITKKYYFLLVLSLLVSSYEIGYTQYNLHFKSYTSSNGLPSGSFSDIIKSPNGYLWLLSENGISKFNGYDFTTYYFKTKNDKSFSSTQMLMSFIDSLGNIFLASKDALFLLDNETNEFKKLFGYDNLNDLVLFESNNRSSYALIKNELYAIQVNPLRINKTVFPNADFKRHKTSSLISDGKMYLSTSELFLRLDLSTMKYQQFYYKSPINLPIYLQKLENNNIQISAANQLFNYSPINKTLVEIPARESENSKIRNQPPLKLVINGCIYYLNRLGLLTKIDLFSGTVRELNLANLLKPTIKENVIFYNITKGTNNNIWVENSGAGLIEIDLLNFEKGIRNHFYDGNSNIPTNNCNKILEDSEGLIWFLSVGRGLIKAEKIKTNFTTIYPGSNVSYKSTSNVRTICEFSENKIAVGTLEGSYLIDINLNDEGQPTPIKTDYFDYKTPIGNITLGNRGEIMLSHWLNKSIIVLDPANKTSTLLNNKNSSKNNGSSYRCSLNDSNNIYFGSSNNALYITQSNLATSNSVPFEIALKRDAFSKNLGIIFCLKKLNKDKIIIGSQNGLYLYSLNNDSLIAFPTKKEKGVEFYNTDIRSLHLQDSKFLWIGTNGNGLIHLNLITLDTKRYTTANGLSDNFVYTILEDSNDNLWMGTNTGINKFNLVNENFQFFTSKDGLGFDEFNTNAACKLSSGKMAFGGVNGLVIFHPDSINYTSKQFPIFLTHFYVNNRPLKLDSTYVLQYDQNYLSFQFAGLTFFRNEDLNYAYKMIGLDTDWILSGDRRFTTYANLLPGNYTFQVRSTDPNGIWNKNILEIFISIKSPWYKEWYAFIFYIFITSSIVYSIYYYKKQQRLKLQYIRDNIARDLHDEIGSNLSSISIFNEVAKESAVRNDDNLQAVLHKIGEYTQISQESMTDIVWMIDSKNDRFENIFIKMRTLASETIGAGNINLSIHFDESLNALKIPMAKRKNFYLIYKEAINNLLKYSNCTHVIINVKKSVEFISLEIIDDGIGFNPNETRGNGLNNMKKRAEELNGQLSISSLYGNGTTIKLKFSL
ncbi:MAG: triple tyrosine motif-containing protein [Bacteroidia bacterium]